MLGISVYFQDLDETYLKEAAKVGAKYVFTSLHIPEEDYSHLDDVLPHFIEICQTLGLELCPDVSPVTFEKLQIPNGDFKRLKAMGFKALRLDYGFDDLDTVKKLSEDFEIMLNASIVDENYIKKAQAQGIDFKQLILTHNFYPKRFTGLSKDSFNSKNQIFRQYGLQIQAFVCGDNLKRFPLYEGLPTLEKHRDTPPFIAALELMANGVSDIMIGDSQAKIETLQAIQTYMSDKVITLKVHLEPEYKHLYNQIISCRKDQSECAIRLATPRLKKVAIQNNGVRRRGAITIDNTLMGRYCGEMQLLKKDLPTDARVNIIGFIHPDYIEALNYINENTKIKFTEL